MEAPSVDLATLQKSYRAGTAAIAGVIEEVIARVDASDPAVWITRVPAEALRARARALDAAAETLPLKGIPFAVKDNIDVAGLPTTAGCPAFAYVPEVSAAVVERLLAAGAILVGKTNLDQFATGLVGTRSPYGVPRNPYGADFIAGGSSSGSAVAVATGVVSFALGTDTAGSGRVPASFCNIVGLKPTRGLLSCRGVVPACRSLDCVSIFAPDVAAARAVFDVASGFDPADPLSRPARAPLRRLPARDFRFGVPAAAELEFFGDGEYARLYDAALDRLAALGGRRVEIPFAPFRRVSALLYDGPRVAERLEATGALLAREPEAILPVTRAILAGAQRFTALDAYRGAVELAALARATAPAWQAIDVLALPTAGTIYGIAEVEAEPLKRNAELGFYTNFVNLLDLAALAVPAGFRSDGLPFGLSLIAPAFADRALAALGRRWQALSAPPRRGRG